MSVARPISEYDRSPALTGVDFAVNVDDVVATPLGDLMSTSGVELITNALLRRLHTPTLGYKRFIRTHEGLVEVDSDYESQVYDHLSAPSTFANNTAIEQAILATAKQEKRIEVISAELTAQPDYATIPVKLTYRILSESELRTVSLVLNVSSTLSS